MLKSELDIATKITCENCGHTDVWGRRIQYFGVIGESRGYADICFDCFGPTREIKTMIRGIVNSPIPKEVWKIYRRKGGLRP